MGKYITAKGEGTEMEMLDRITKAAQEFRELYQLGVISFDCGYVQVGREFLLNMPGELQEKERQCFEYPYELCKVYSGLKFLAVADMPTTPEFVEKAIAKLRDVANG